MKAEYAVAWREDDVEDVTGMLEVRRDALVLTTGDDHTASRELRFDELITLTLVAQQDGPPRLALRTCDGRTVELVSIVDEWIARDLVDHLLTHALRSDIPLRFLVSCEPLALAHRWHPGLGLS